MTREKVHKARALVGNSPLNLRGLLAVMSNSLSPAFQGDFLLARQVFNSKRFLSLFNGGLPANFTLNSFGKGLEAKHMGRDWAGTRGTKQASKKDAA